MRPLITAVLVVVANDLLLAALFLPNAEFALVGFAALVLTLPLYALSHRTAPDTATDAQENTTDQLGRQTHLGEF